MIHTKFNKIPNTVLIFVLMAPFTSLFYLLYMLNPSNIVNPYLYAVQLFADIIAIISVMSLWLTIILDLLQSEQTHTEFIYNKNWLKEEKPSVDVLLPVTNEPEYIIINTVEKVLGMKYPHTVYLLDDGDSKYVKDLADKYKVMYIKRPPHMRHYAKSGNLNYALKQCKGDFFAVFDADHAPYIQFLEDLLPLFENENVALVQTPQHYTNTNNFIASGTAQAQEIFYKYVQPAKNSFNAAFCVGTNMIYRRKIIDEIGGIYLTHHSEDILTSLEIHKRGYTSVYYNKILANGRAPDSIESFLRQQNRWARGGFFLFFHSNPLFIKGLSTDQRLQYAFSNIHYFSGFTILIYLLLPICYLFFNIHAMRIDQSANWLIHYSPFFITIYFLPVFLLGKIKLSTISTALASFSPYIQAFFSVVLKNRYHWIATEVKSTTHISIMAYIWPHLLIIFLSLTSVLVGWYKTDNVPTTSIMSFWVLLNSYFLFSFIKNGLLSTYEK